MSRQEQQLVDFLLLHPEHYAQLHQAGMEHMLEHPLALAIVDHVGKMAGLGCQPEQLLVGMEDPVVATYMVQVLTEVPPYSEEDEARPEEGMVEELLRWLLSERQRRLGAGLQERIAEAERLGNTALLMTLLREKQDLEKKRQQF